jgi:hypothetical protein
MRRSAQALDLRLPVLRQVVTDLLAAWGERDGALRLIVTRGGTVRGICSAPTWPATISLAVVEAPWRTPISGVKTLSYAANQWALRTAKDAGADDALIVDAGQVLELPTGSVCLVHDGTVSSPAADELPILDSVTVRSLTHVVPVERTTPTLDDLRRADEIFVVSATRPVLPVHAVLLPDGSELTRRPPARSRRTSPPVPRLHRGAPRPRWLTRGPPPAKGSARTAAGRSNGRPAAVGPGPPGHYPRPCQEVPRAGTRRRPIRNDDRSSCWRTGCPSSTARTAGRRPPAASSRPSDRSWTRPAAPGSAGTTTRAPCRHGSRASAATSTPWRSRRGWSTATTTGSPTGRCGRCSTTSSSNRSSTGAGGAPTRTSTAASRRRPPPSSSTPTRHRCCGSTTTT